MHSFKLNPTPRVLIVLTETAMKPIDALCELVDNSIDSFRNTGLGNTHTNEIHIEIPTQGDLQDTDDKWFIRASDNGPGMSPDAAEKALTAGYTSQELFGSLGFRCRVEYCYWQVCPQNTPNYSD